MQKILTHLEEKATRKGFSEYFAECTGKISQRIFTKMEYLAKREIEYQTFEYEGKLPFKSLTEADYIKLMVRKVASSTS